MSREDTRANWQRDFNLALEVDTWGQVEEAQEKYEKLAAQILAVESNNAFGLSAEEKLLLSKLSATLGLRGREIRQDFDRDLGSEGMKMLAPVFKEVLVKPNVRLPVEVPGLLNIIQRKAMEPSGPKDNDLDEGGNTEDNGTLMPPLVLHRGEKALTIHIDRMGFKDATVFINSFMTISVRDRASNLVEGEQDTPVTNRNKPSYVLFGNEVHIQTPLGSLQAGSSIFFEFKHFKPKKKVSCKAWAVLDLEDIHGAEEPEVALEIYKKPVNLQKKGLQLLSVKPLYLHLRLQKRAA